MNAAEQEVGSNNSSSSNVNLRVRYARGLPATFGQRRDEMPDHLYTLSNGRAIFTSPWVNETSLRRCSANIGISTTGKPFKITVAKHAHWYSAAAIKAMIPRELFADNVGLIGFQFDPSHPCFPHFRRILSSGVLPLDRAHFDCYNEQFDLAYRGLLTISDAKDLFDSVTATALRSFPRVMAIDTRVQKVIDLLWEKYDYPLAELASLVGLSYHRLSHLFADNMGITLRSYQQWRKIRKAISLSKENYTMAELAIKSGFTDAAHFSKVFAQLHAAPPSYFFYSGNVKIIAEKS